MTPTDEWRGLAARATVLGDQLKAAPYAGLGPDARLLADAVATVLWHLSREIELSLFDNRPKVSEPTTVVDREGTMHLQIKLTREETMLYHGTHEYSPDKRRELLRALYIKACRLVNTDGCPVDIVDYQGVKLDTID